MAEGIGGAMGAVGGGTPREQINQFKEFLQSYNRVSEQCFADCVNDFTSRSVSGKETDCSIKCLTKYLQSTQRISLRFQEHLQQTDALAKQAQPAT